MNEGREDINDHRMIRARVVHQPFECECATHANKHLLAPQQLHCLCVAIGHLSVHVEPVGPNRVGEAPQRAESDEESDNTVRASLTALCFSEATVS